jgi:hypothetical protein
MLTTAFRVGLIVKVGTVHREQAREAATRAIDAPDTVTLPRDLLAP